MPHPRAPVGGRSRRDALSAPIGGNSFQKLEAAAASKGAPTRLLMAGRAARADQPRFHSSAFQAPSRSPFVLPIVAALHIAARRARLGARGPHPAAHHG
eukprot:CAMPEP_0176136592 /NCGR_PEP_ID=MMETSP0120_2-20121206/69321_1 /TAXON_ID=160619 /ORGANISM="Kryptoperidinium foliaceum, Strain CCMP 1326" /LENGTH=98 /DNA_ID=CAMNT_0017472375 /DNA_START=185 /DNA_END=477 /DNA_ORIENTATION=+